MMLKIRWVEQVARKLATLNLVTNFDDFVAVGSTSISALGG